MDIRYIQFITEWIQGGVLLPGCEDDQDPYRSELGGQLGLAAVASVIIFPNGHNHVLTIVCDGMAVLNQVGMDRTIIKARLEYVDIISVITTLWENSPFTTVKEQVYGYQYILDLSLTQLDMLNYRVDLEAKEIAQDYIHNTLAPPSPPYFVAPI